MKRMILTVAGLMVVLVVSTPQASAVLLTDVSASATSFAGQREDPMNAVNGVGMVGDAHTNENWFVRTGDCCEQWVGAMWHTAINVWDGSLFIDLKSNHKLESEGTLKIWNFNGLPGGGNDYTFRGIKGVNIFWASDDSGPVLTGTAVPAVSWNDLNNLQIKDSNGGAISELSRAPVPPSSNYNTPDTVDFGEVVNARYIRIEKVSDHGADVAVGLSEVQVFGIIPEPASITLLAGGLLAMLRRSRR